MIFTIITVTFNSATTLPATLASVLSQQGVALEYIIIDGASTDGTIEVIKQAAARDKRIRWISEPDAGIYDAMNKGWAAAADDSFILYLGAGDKIISLPQDMSKFSSLDVPYGSVNLESRIFQGEAGNRLKFNNTLHHQALLVHKSFHPEPPFDTKFKMYADFDFNQRLLKMGARFVYVPEFRAYALPGGFSSKKDYFEILRVVRKNFGFAVSLVAFCYLSIRKTLGRDLAVK